MLRILLTLLLLASSSASAQYIGLSGGGSGGGAATSITSGTTTITGCSDKQILFTDTTVLGCDAGLTYTKATDALAVTGSVAIGSATIGSNALAVTGRSVFNDLITLNSNPKTVTITIASPAVVTISGGHALSAGDPVFFYTTGALPTGITANQVYFVIAAGLTSTQFEFSATVGGAAINTSGTQSGVQTVAVSRVLAVTDSGTGKLWIDRRGNIVMTDGTAVGIASGEDNSALTTSMQLNVNGRLEFISNNNTTYNIFNQSIVLSNNTLFGWSDTTAHNSTTLDLILRRKTTASIVLGAADAASPVAQTLGVQGVVAGTSNTAGADFTIAGSVGTGTGAGGSILLQVASAGSTGNSQNALATKWTFRHDGVLVTPSQLQIIASGQIFILTAGGTITAPAAGAFALSGRGFLQASANGVWYLSNAAVDDFGRLGFGGVTSAFGAINRDGAGLRVSAADGTTAGPFTISGSALNVTASALGMAKMIASASAPGAAGSKLEVVCGTNAGTAKLIMYAGTSGTAVTVLDNVGTGVTGC